MRAITICLIAIAVTGNVLTSTALAQGSNAAVRLNLPGGGAQIICLASAIELGVSGTELLLRADALQNNLGCPPGVTSPTTDPGVDQPTQSLRGSTNARAILRLDLPGGGSTDKCLLLGSGAASAVDQASFMNLQALQADGGCPPPAVVTLNDFQISPSTLNIADGVSNCVLGGQPRQCLSLSWNTSVAPGVLTPVCTVSQTAPGGEFSMQPAGFDNPGTFVNPGNPGQFVSIENELLWPVNALSASTGSKSFRMQCEPGGQSITRTVTFNESFVDINSFNITQTSAEQGGTINFSWNVSLINNPPGASCELRSLTSGIINPVTINVQTTPVGSSQASILPGASLGNRVFRFSCSPGNDSLDDNVEIIEPGLLELQTFDIIQTSAAPGSTINFNWTLTRSGTPQNPSCTLSANNSGVLAQAVTINNPGDTGSGSASILSGSPGGAQGFTFSCSPGGTSTGDVVNVITPEVIPVSFVPDAIAIRGQSLDFDWSALLVNNPPSPTCTVSSPNVVNSLDIVLPTSPANQSGSNSIDILGNAPLGDRTLRFQCNPGGQFIEAVVNVQSPPPPAVFIEQFELIESSVPQGGVINASWTARLENSPVAPYCLLLSNGVIVGNIKLFPLPLSPSNQSGEGSADIRSDAIINPGNNVTFACGPDIDNFTAFTESLVVTLEVVPASSPNVGIQTFNIREDSINPGQSFTFDWAVVVSGSPPSPSCLLTSSMSGVIADQTVNLQPTPSNQSGSLTVPLLSGAPTGVQLFNFSCSPGSSTRSDSLTIVPPDANPRVQINSFSLSQDSAVQGSNIGFNWNVTLIDNPATPVCSVNATGVINSVTIPLATSPSTQSGSGNATILGSAPTGVRTFTLNCSPGGSSSIDTALITAPATPEIFIDDFQIVQSSVERGGFIDFNWAVSLVNNPLNPSCSLSAVGVLNNNPVNIPLSAAPTQSGNGSAQISASAPTGNRNFVFSCTSPGTGSVTRVVEITANPTPSVGIIDFNADEADVLQGGSFNFNWSVLLTDIAGPGIASCTLSSPGVLAAPVTIQLDPINGLTQSGVASAQVSATAGTGVQSLQFSCTPGGALRTDSINVQSSGGDPDVIINSFNIIQATASVGSQLQFDWSITLVDGPQNVSCTLSSDNASVINNFTLNLPSSPSLQSGSSTVNINPTAATGAQGFRFTCQPGGDQLVDSVNITLEEDPIIEINSFNIIETGAAQGGTINFVWDVTLLNNPANPQCVLSSNSTGVISDQVINLAASPANQNGGGSVSISTTAATGIQGFLFECTPGTQSRTDSVNITAPGTLNLLFFDLRNISAAQGSDIIFDFTVQRINNPVNPECTLTGIDNSTTPVNVIDPVTIPIPTFGTTVQDIVGASATILIDAPLGNATFTLNCSPGGQSAAETIQITTLPDPSISINSFNIIEQSVNPGDTINFDYSVERIGVPAQPQCVLLATNTIDTVTIDIATSGSANVTGSGTAEILASAPSGNINFTFACRVSPADPFVDAFTDIVFIN